METIVPGVLSQQQYGVISSPLETDLFSFDLAAGSTYYLGAQGFDIDLFLEVRDRKGRVLARGDDFRGTDDPRILFTPEQSDNYFIIVGATSAGTGRQFSLFVQDVDSIPEFDRDFDPITGVDFSSPSGAFYGLSDLALRSSVSSALSDDGYFDKQELSEVLLTSGQSGVVGEEQFGDLLTLSGNLSRFLRPTDGDYLQYIYDSVVLGSPANNYWTGGALKSVDLGGLNAGSTERHLQRLVDKWFFGLDLPTPIAPGDSARGEADTYGSYAMASGPLFDHDITFTDVHQGQLGTCWFVSAAASLAAWKPDTVRSLFIDNKDGTFGVKFYQLSPETHDSAGMPSHWVTVNRDLMVFQNSDDVLLGTHSTPNRLLTDEIWPGLLEKAAAQASELGIFASVRHGQTANSFSSIVGGYDEGSAMLDEISLRSAGSSQVEPYRFMPLSRYFVPGSLGEFKSFENEYKRAISSGQGPGTFGSGINLDTNFLPTSEQGERTFVDGHQFAVVGFDEATNQYELYNPWGPSPIPGVNFLSPFTIKSQDVFRKFLVPSRQGDFSEFSFAA